MAREIVDFPIKNGDFPWQNVSSPEGNLSFPIWASPSIFLCSVLEIVDAPIVTWHISKHLKTILANLHQGIFSRLQRSPLASALMANKICSTR